MTCPLCHTPYRNRIPFARDQSRTYAKCDTCQLIATPPKHHLPFDEERSRYDMHQNDPTDPRYRRFLSRLFSPMNKILPSGSHGLDFGCGPGPTLHLLFEETGHTMHVYDPHYFPDVSLLTQDYDFITASEVMEHLYDPNNVFTQLFKQLKPGGLLGVMTQSPPQEFDSWGYKNDPTHVCFYSRPTFDWIAEKWNASIVYTGDSVVIFQV